MCLTVIKSKRKMVSKHYKTKRSNREKFIVEQLGGYGKVVDSFIVDTGHPKGKEIHQITDNGIIKIYNANSGVFITSLIARVGQIKRYYKLFNREPPKEYKDIIKLAQMHKQLGYNYI